MGRGHEEGWKHFTGILAEKIQRAAVSR
jgi:hypothetical protein